MVSETQLNIATNHFSTSERPLINSANGASFEVRCCCCSWRPIKLGKGLSCRLSSQFALETRATVKKEANLPLSQQAGPTRETWKTSTTASKCIRVKPPVQEPDLLVSSVSSNDFSSDREAKRKLEKVNYDLSLENVSEDQKKKKKENVDLKCNEILIAIAIQKWKSKNREKNSPNLPKLTKSTGKRKRKRRKRERKSRRKRKRISSSRRKKIAFQSELDETNCSLANVRPAESESKSESESATNIRNNNINNQSVQFASRESRVLQNSSLLIERTFTPLEANKSKSVWPGKEDLKVANSEHVGSEVKSELIKSVNLRTKIEAERLRVDLNWKKKNSFGSKAQVRGRVNRPPFAPTCEASKRPLERATLALLLLLAVVVSSEAASWPSQGFSALEGAKLLVSERSSSRQQRQLATGWTSWSAAQQPQEPQQIAGRQQNVPYKTFFVTRACEWKSNLFVPKSNDIHFAQSSQPGAGELSSQNQESTLVYETFNGQPGQQQQFSKPTTNFNTYEADGARTMLSTDSKALILALPIVMSQSFAGYEPACSIRLIVPRNMRILAQLSSRRLTFAQEQVVTTPDQISSPATLEQRQPLPTLWLNVSQNQFAETEHKSIESEGNVLAFRFLLERFANKQAPDTRFQVVLTAFQSLGDNSDLLDSGQLFICDQQRLISASLACDGFKNCQDGHDESEATCASSRLGPSFNQHATTTHPNNQMSTEQTTTGAGDDHRAPLLVRLWNYARETNTLVGFLIGFLLVLAFLTCCACCSYACYRLYHTMLDPSRAHSSANRRHQRVEALDGESDALAAQNSENAARLKRSMIEEPSRGRAQTGHSSTQIPPRLQSILKKPGLHPKQPPPAPPTVPSRQSVESPAGDKPGVSRGALSSSLSKSQRPSIQSDVFRPTPARRATRPTRPVPVPAGHTSSSIQSHPHQLAKPRSPEVPTTPARFATGANVTTTTTGSQRITTYHYSSGTTRFSEQYLEKLANEQRQQEQQRQQVPGQRASNVNYTGREPSVSPKQSSLI